MSPYRPDDAPAIVVNDDCHALVAPLVAGLVGSVRVDWHIMGGDGTAYSCSRHDADYVMIDVEGTLGCLTVEWATDASCESY